MEHRYINVKNGDLIQKYYIYTCENCKSEVSESHPRFITDNNDVLCVDCAFIGGFLSEKEYLTLHGISMANVHVKPENGKIVLYFGKGYIKDTRHTPKYREWRTSVFERDKYRCVNCGKVGGELQAHHIKSYAKHKDLRLDINNGVTLCKSCHKDIHKKKVIAT